MTTEKYGCRALAAILRGHGVERVMLCPGTRDLPLVMAFAREKGMICNTAVDERSAAFIALGQSIASGKAVAAVCTSGTALLNMAPAVAEAYYRCIPLIVVSADRPARWIDQADSQTIRQPGALANIVKRSYNIVAEAVTADARWCVERTLNDAVMTAMTGRPGPVHINVEIDEPISSETEVKEGEYRIIKRGETRMSLTEDARRDFASRMLGKKRVLVLLGGISPDDRLNRALNRLAGNGNVAVLAEPLANVGAGVRNIEATLCLLGESGRRELKPDLLITAGGAIVSGMAKKWLRECAPAEHWHVAEGDSVVDTYMCLTERIDMAPADFLRETAEVMRHGREYGGEGSDYGERWMKASEEAYIRTAEIVDGSEWSDLTAVKMISEMIPDGVNVQLSNGMTVRYHEWLSRRRAHRTDCNRGVSGIDGSTSTAIGVASVYKGMTVLLTGDMSAQYDIGALASWRLAGERFKMVVFANGGGNIFKYIKNTRDTAESERYLYNKVDTDWRMVCEAYGASVYEAYDAESLRRQCAMWLEENDRCSVLIVNTNADVNAKIMTELTKIKKI